jgi:hypothetical protein
MSKKLDEVDTDSMIVLFREHMAGKPLSFHGPEVDKFIEELERDKRQAEANGWVLTIPGEIEVA